MKIKGGYFKKILEIDLGSRQSRVLDLSDEFVLKYIGGRGFGAKLVWDNMRPDLDPLGPDNIIVIAPGPLTGVFLPAAGKTSFVSISPATGIYADSNVGGMFGVELRQAGYDALVIKGCADKLSYIWIDDGQVEIVENEALKGRGSLETEGMIRHEIGDEMVKVATIGPAGENLVGFACVTADWGRNAGRTGMGAIMGSKNLKAVAIRGSQDLPVHDVKLLRDLANDSFARLKKNPYFEFWQRQGLMSVVDYLNHAGLLPTYNFSDGCFDRAESINGYEMEERYKIGDTACFGCPMACGNINLVKEGEYAGTVVEGPEYETACMFGSNIGVDNFAFILKANALCDELGIDTISAGNLIGVLMEGCKRGDLKPEDIDGMALDWGDEEGTVALLKKMARREGVGDVLADGAKRVIEKWPALKPIISEVKGLEQSAYDGRATISMALAFATSDIGAHHARAWTVGKELEMGAEWGIEEKVDLVIYHQETRPVFDMLGVCRLPWIELGFSELHYPEFYRAVTGVSMSIEEMFSRSDDLYNLTRLINIDRGVTRKDDYPPDRCFDLPIPSGPQAGKVADRDEYERMLQLYYEKRGWDENGVPKESVRAQFSDKLNE
jgi:aldehyde:ferredoxin oxidoreductase